MTDTSTPTAATTIDDATIAALAGTYTLDPTHSQVGFVARHAMVTKVRGSFNEFEGSATIDAAGLEKSSVSVTIQAASIDTRNEDRDGHLRGNDFLDLETFPLVTFVSTEVTQTGPVTLDITGDLTVKGTTRSVTVPFAFEGAATDPFGSHRIGFEGSAAISRKDFGITWNAALETGGVLIGDKIVLEFEISAVKDA